MKQHSLPRHAIHQACALPVLLPPPPTRPTLVHVGDQLLLLAGAVWSPPGDQGLLLVSQTADDGLPGLSVRARLRATLLHTLTGEVERWTEAERWRFTSGTER